MQCRVEWSWVDAMRWVPALCVAKDSIESTTAHTALACVERWSVLVVKRYVTIYVICCSSVLLSVCASRYGLPLFSVSLPWSLLLPSTAYVIDCESCIASNRVEAAWKPPSKSRRSSNMTTASNRRKSISIDHDGSTLSTEHKAYLLKRHGTIDLAPLPSMDPNDPYNW